MATITADMLTEISKPMEICYLSPEIVPGDTVRVSREFEVTEVGYNELTDNKYYGTYGGYKYGSNNWNVEKIKDKKYLHTLIFGGYDKEEQMSSYKSIAAAAGVGEVVGNERLTEITRYSDLKAGDTIRVTRDAVVSNTSTWDGITTKDGRKIRIAAAETADLKKSGFKVQKVEKINPDYWPPKAGDTWMAGSVLYFATVSAYGSSNVLLRPADGFNHGNLSVSELKDKKPVLKYRQGVTLS